MTITKEKLHQHIDEFPDEISIDEVIERLIMIEKLEIRKKESENNETISEEELKKEMEKWFKQNG
ncbi:hypothetical protein [Chryseobacterium sp.]|uniref:hypothetical protein n=1 Tax=Chryseobacterium sp. TaxID=1871047 RepID=UPI00289D7B8D|nr:hypothetical protein [Chryseobacterium sp.]